MDMCAPSFRGAVTGVGVDLRGRDIVRLLAMGLFRFRSFSGVARHLRIGPPKSYNA
jgi:hypothetical protein